MPKQQQIQQLANKALQIEIESLQGLQQRLLENKQLSLAVDLILANTGRLIVMGMGKSGHVGRKIAATLSSVGTPAIFVHPAEASHGDLGMIAKHEVVIAISNSGESQEILSLLPVLKRLEIKIIAITGNLASNLAKHADAVLNSFVAREACPLNLAPTASTTVQMVIGDILATVLLEIKGFKKEDFAFSHPGGLLGRKLLLHVSDMMRTAEQLPLVSKDTSLLEAMKVIGHKGVGAVLVTNAKKELLGIFTDGDLRRLLADGNQIIKLTVGEVMVVKPKFIYATALAVEAATLMENFKIACIPVLAANNSICGIVTSNDLMREKVI